MDENLANDTSAVVEVNPDSVVEQEKSLPQSQVNKIIQHEKTKAELRGRREAEETYKREIEALQSQIQRGTNQSAEPDKTSDPKNEVIYQDFKNRFVSEIQAVQQQKEEADYKKEMEKVVDTYYTKMSEGKKAYDDFEEVTKVFNPAAFPALSALASRLDNTADIIYELANNPSKLVTLDSLVNKNPQHAEAELLKLSKSIATNRKAQAESGSNQAAAPLERLQPSKVVGSNGKLSVRDLRAQPWLKG